VIGVPSYLTYGALSLSFSVSIEVFMISIIDKLSFTEKRQAQGKEKKENQLRKFLHLKQKEKTTAIERMVLALQAARLRVIYNGWSGLCRVEALMGVTTFYIQATFLRLAISAKDQLTDIEGAKKPLSPKQWQPASKEKKDGIPVTQQPLMLGKGRVNTESTEDLKKSQVLARRVTEPVPVSPSMEKGGSAEKEKGAPEDEGKLEVNNEFSRGLDTAIEKIEKVSGRFKGRYLATKIGVSFTFSILGFGITTRMEIESTSIIPTKIL